MIIYVHNYFIYFIYSIFNQPPAITTAVGFSPMLGRPTTDRIEDNRRLRGAPVEAMWDSWSTVFLHAIYEYMKTTELTEFSTLSNFVQ